MSRRRWRELSEEFDERWETATMSTTAGDETSSGGRGATMTGPGRGRTGAGMTGTTGEGRGLGRELDRGSLRSHVWAPRVV
ncbi:hypothetical protein AAFF_G00281860 [Aldrovandia affinis]|uniref:Uncharacterized protein n=1 Tax=Aldrovandia affinis TaxID=143900 RepID=A0AAD7RA67_9TELE|nr:hypothetical protein AAFF_G00281860 [Aldrovandia affinis]